MALFDRTCLNPGVAPKEVIGWALYDAANSGYSTVVMTAVFNAYFVEVICGNTPWATLAWTCAIALSNAVGMLLMPSIGRLADVTAKKKIWLLISTLLCIAATAGLGFTGPGTIATAVFFIVVSNLGFNLGESLNSAFLPELARPEATGKVSGWGWSLGYVGGLLTLGCCLIVVVLGPQYGMDSVRVVAWTNWITAGLFFIISIPVFLWLKERASPQTHGRGLVTVWRENSGQLMRTLRSLPGYRDFACLVVCGFFYQCGIAVVVTLAAIYASQVLGFEVTETLVMVLVVNVTAAFGAFGFGYVQDALGHKRALALTLIVWIVMAMLAANATELWLFWVSANLAGLAMGSSQSGGRAMVALFAPKRRLAEFYGVWNMALWLSAIVGPLTYGVVTWATGNDHRLAMMVMSGFFVVGVVTLLLVNVERGKERANQTDRDEALQVMEKG